MSTLQEYISEQENLVQAASEALPHQFSRCTYGLGPLRQAVYLCLACPEARGICSACSIACHTDHEQVELFPKRNFRCDCPTSSIAHSCSLHTDPEPPNLDNKYGQNFGNKFCRCGRLYDAQIEKEAMIQCLSCEDWFHESCCNLREQPTSREPTPDPPGDDSVSETSSALPPPLISGEEYECFLCASCVTDLPILRRLAGTPGFMMIVRDTDTAGAWKVLKDHPSPSATENAALVTAGVKRTRSSSPNIEEPHLKRPRPLQTDTSEKARESSGVCLLPPPNMTAQNILSHDKPSAVRITSAGDLFVTEGFRERWCRCSNCLSLLLPYPFLLEEEETYEPPEDPDSGVSLDELGMRALEALPRDRAIDGIHAFNALRDDLVQYLRPFAQENRVVNEADITSFFESRNETQRVNSASNLGV